MRSPRLGQAAAAFAVLAVLAAAAFLGLTRPSRLDPGALPSRRPDLANGEVVYRAASCCACHNPAPGVSGAAARLPSGGAAFVTPVGTFYPGNLTPDPETGLGRWTASDFVNAMTRGVAPDGRHYFPAFPYTSYAALRVEDVLDLYAYLMGLPPVKSPARAPSLRLERLARRSVGLWKRVAFDPRPFAPDPARGAAWNRGAYLVEAPGHCGECHTPRDRLMRRDAGRHLAGGPHPAGEGKVPSLRGLVARKRYEDAADLAAALQYGETLGYDKLSSGGMAAIQTSLSQLPESDLRAMAEYLLSLE
jgi:mono/diheme cytochrome c family protein